jgi:hypothetical protein
MVLLILAVIWAAVLVPPWLQNRKESRPGDSIASFRQQLHVLERAAPGYRPSSGTVTRLADHRPPVASPVTTPVATASTRRPGALRRPEALRRAEVRKRRRDVFLTLLGAVGLTFLMALAVGGPVWTLHLGVLILFAGYVGMLVKLQQQGAEREVKVRYLASGQASRPEPALLLRRSGS